MSSCGSSLSGARVRGRWARAFLCCTAVLALAAGAVLADAPASINVVLSEATPAYREVADAFTASLGDRYPVRTSLLTDWEAGEPVPGGQTLLVPIGVRAAKRVYQEAGDEAAVLSLLVPRATAQSLADGRSPGSSVYIDQPPARSLAFVKLVLPRARRIGVLLSAETAPGLRSIAAGAARARLDLVPDLVANPQDVSQALQRILPKVDALLLVPDSVVVNDNTVRHILLASYRQRIPVIGFSRGLATAGAVASMVSDPVGIGREGAQLARQWNPATGSLPGARHASAFDLVFNRQVARSLGIEIPESAAELARWRQALD
jgi:ABC-type uncharacterized transport system substrate-binding protein